jgi:stress response protein YsnF
MLNNTEIRDIIGTTAYGADGEKIGKIGQVFLDDQTGRPEFVTIQTGLFGTSESFAPLAAASMAGDRLTVPFTKDQVKDAPNVALDGGHIDQAEERRLYEHYGMSYSESVSDSGLPDAGLPDAGLRDDALDYEANRPSGYDVSGTTDEAMTRSEEHLTAGTRIDEVGRARLRKYVVTEQETVAVPVRKERARLEREPITEANRDDAMSGPEITEAEHEVVLHEERPVVGTTTEPVERVRLGTETTTEQETVSGEVRKERIDVEGDVDERP